MSDKETSLNSPRNSPLRAFASNFESAVAMLSHRFPDLRPNHITAAGTLSVAAISALTAYLEKHKRLDSKNSMRILLAMVVANGTDALDGMLARQLIKDGDQDHDPKVGQVIDTLSDRTQEAISAWLAMYRAAETRDTFWLATASLTAVTNPLSSLTRAFAEKNGTIVHENGKNALQFAGTRAGRASLSLPHFIPRRAAGPTSVQGLADGLQVASNLNTTAARITSILSGQYNSNQQLDAEVQEDAEVRFRYLAALYLITTTLTGALFFLLRKNGNKY